MHRSFRPQVLQASEAYPLARSEMRRRCRTISDRYPYTHAAMQRDNRRGRPFKTNTFQAPQHDPTEPPVLADKPVGAWSNRYGQRLHL